MGTGCAGAAVGRSAGAGGGGAPPHDAGDDGAALHAAGRAPLPAPGGPAGLAYHTILLLFREVTCHLSTVSIEGRLGHNRLGLLPALTIVSWFAPNELSYADDAWGQA